MKKYKVLPDENKPSTCANTRLCAGTKLEAIKQSYGEHWETVKDFVDENGYVDISIYPIEKITAEFKEYYPEYLKKSSLCRPISIKDIENNRGWIKIENFEQIIPEDYDSLYFVGTMFEGGFNQRAGILSHSGLLSILEYEKHTHYMKIPIPNPPIY